MAVTALLKKKISIVLVLLLALLLITLVIWFFNKRIKKIEKAYPGSVSYVHLI